MYLVKISIGLQVDGKKFPPTVKYADIRNQDRTLGKPSDVMS